MKIIGFLIALITSSIAFTNKINAQSEILGSVKRNPDEAKSICQNFRELNKKEISAGSKQSIQEISEKKNISEIDAEILSMYVRGLYCPETF